MADYIRREDYCEENCGKENREGYKTCKNCSMLNVPSANVQPVKHGKWKKKKGYLVCSNCGMTFDTIGYTYEEQDEVFRYCSCCGYRMDGDAE